MPEFASSSTNVAEITDIQLAQGFGGCDVDGMLVNSANLNAVLRDIQGGLAAQDADLDARTDVLETLILQIVPIGGIIMWSGASVPTGWALCDGTSGTPDLRDRFVIGSGGAYSIGDTGGADNHDHGGTTGATQLTDADLPDHRHFAVIPGTATGAGASAGVSPYEASNSGGDQEYSLDFAATEPTASRTSGAVTMAGSAITPGAGHTHSINQDTSLPPYYALAFIMKV